MEGKKRCWTSRIKRDKEEKKGKSRDHAETSREKNKNPDDFSPIEYFAWRNERREEFIPPTEGTISNCPIEAKEKWGEFHGVEIKRMEKQKEPCHTFPILIEATANFILAFQEKYPFNTINSWNCPPMRWLNCSRSNLLSFSLTTDWCVEDRAECSDFPHRDRRRKTRGTNKNQLYIANTSERGRRPFLFLPFWGDAEAAMNLFFRLLFPPHFLSKLNRPQPGKREWAESMKSMAFFPLSLSTYRGGGRRG